MQPLPVPFLVVTFHLHSARTSNKQALESLQKLKKEKVQATKEMKLKLETLKSHKDAAQKLQQQLHSGNAQAVDLEANIGVLQVPTVMWLCMWLCGCKFWQKGWSICTSRRLTHHAAVLRQQSALLHCLNGAAA